MNTRPKNPKKECPRCKRPLRVKNFVYNRMLKEKVCGRCDNQVGNNLFYVPRERRRQFIGRFSMSDAEKDELHRELVRQGMDSVKAWNRVHYTERMMRLSYRRMKGLQAIQRNREIKQQQEAQEQKKAFVRGLK